MRVSEYREREIMGQPDQAIDVSGLSKNYGDVEAVKDVSFSVARG